MPFVGAFHEIHSLAHDGVEENHHRLAVAREGPGLSEGVEDGLHIVAVGLDAFPSESLPFGLEVSKADDRIHRAVYLLMVPVGHGYEVVHLVVGGEHGGLPYLAFLALAVAAEDVDSVVLTVQSLAKGGAAGYGETLTE